MREITRIIMHCSATEAGRDFDAEDIRTWHKARGWSDIGYHYVIKLDGTIEAGRPVDRVGAHTKGHNEDSVGVCYIGGLKDGKPFDTMSEIQEIAFIELVFSLRNVFGWMPIHGHNEYAAKACPSFNVQVKYKFLNLNNGIHYH